MAKKDKKTNNDQHNTTQKARDGAIGKKNTKKTNEG